MHAQRDGAQASRAPWPADRWLKVLTAVWWFVVLANGCIGSGSSCNLTTGALVALLMMVLSVPLAVATVAWASRQRAAGKRWGAVTAMGLSPGVAILAILTAMSLASGFGR